MHIVHAYCYVYCSVLWLTRPSRKILPGGSGYNTCDMGLHPLKGVSKEINFTNGRLLLASCFNRYFRSLVANKKASALVQGETLATK